MREIKFNLALPMSSLEKVKAYAERAESLGFYSVSFGDHLFVRLEHMSWRAQIPQLECFTTLGAVAALTGRVKIVIFVAAVPFRSPALLAKMTSTLDHISGGRLIAGLGTGWFRDEFEAYGYGFASDTERTDRMEEAIQILKAMWTEEEPTYRGRYYSIERAVNYPKPVQKPHPPIMIGGAGKRILQITAREADIANVVPILTKNAGSNFDKARLKRRLGMLQNYARAAGRDPDSIEISGFPFVFISKDHGEADAMAAKAARRRGLPDAEAARQSPGLLVGTPEQIRREIRSRIEEFNMTYYMVSLATPEAVELFAIEVMPEFSR